MHSVKKTKPKVHFNTPAPLWPEQFTDVIAIDTNSDQVEVTKIMIDVTEEIAGVPHYLAEHYHVYSDDEETIRLTVEKLREHGFAFTHCHIPREYE